MNEETEMVKLVNRLTGGYMWVAEERLEEYKAAGYKLAADGSSGKPAKQPEKKTDEKAAAKPAAKKPKAKTKAKA